MDEIDDIVVNKIQQIQDDINEKYEKINEIKEDIHSLKNKVNARIDDYNDKLMNAICDHLPKEYNYHVNNRGDGDYYIEIETDNTCIDISYEGRYEFENAQYIYSSIEISDSDDTVKLDFCDYDFKYSQYFKAICEEIDKKLKG